MGGGGIVVLYPQLLTEISKCVIVEMLSIVRDEDPMDFKVANDTFSNYFEHFSP